MTTIRRLADSCLIVTTDQGATLFDPGFRTFDVIDLDSIGDIQRVLITELKNSTYYARLFLEQKNELDRKIVELDARPSDSIALATAHKKPIYVTRKLFDQVEDMSAVLAQAQSDNEESETEEEDSD